MSDFSPIFDRKALRRNRERAATQWDSHDFLYREVAARLHDRLGDMARAFPRVLDLSGRTGTMAEALRQEAGAEWLVQCDLSERMARRARTNGPTVVLSADALPFAPQSFDLIVSCLDLHWIDDLPGALLQVRQCLKPDGLFVAALLGGESLHELRASLTEAETQASGGSHLRVSPMTDVRDAGALLQRAGFALPVADLDSITVTYENSLKLLHDLRGMGEVSALHQRPRNLSRRSMFLELESSYRSRHALSDGRLPATFQIIFLTAWAPHESQQKPLRPGSAGHRLAEALDAEEKSAGETVLGPAALPDGQSKS